MVFHDFGHVLAGYSTTPEDEIRQGAFPATGPQTGLFDVPKVLRAAQRGASCKVDLSHRRDPFAVADASLEQIRAEYGIPAL